MLTLFKDQTGNAVTISIYITSAHVQGGKEKTSYSAYLRFYQARQETAEVKSRTQSPASATSTASSSSNNNSSISQSKPPPSAGSKERPHPCFSV